MAYRDITSGAGLMEPLGEGKPLLSMQDLESRLVFTKCMVITMIRLFPKITKTRFKTMLKS